MFVSVGCWGGLLNAAMFGDMVDSKGNVIRNPWEGGEIAAPFDEAFYLGIGLGVGGTAGWFPDAEGKPWVDTFANPQAQFWGGRDAWEPTWGQGEERGMTIKSVKMWQEGKCS